MIPIILIDSTWPPETKRFNNTIVLHYDNWNDYGLRTTFGMSYFNENGSIFEIGTVKILCMANESVDSNHGQHTRTIIGNQIETLDSTFCSLGQDVGYYVKLKALLPNEYYDVLQRLNDIAVLDDVRERVWEETGVQTSLLRFSGAEKALKEAKEVLGLLKITEKDLSFEYLAHVPYDSEAVRIHFDFHKDNLLPYRTNIIIGKNGTGKTQILTTLANSLSGYTDDINWNIFPKGRPAFDKVMSISYSAFDSFKRPKHSNRDETRVLFSYVYCGIQSENGTLSLEQLRDNLYSSYTTVKEKNRQEIWIEVLSQLFEQEHSNIIEQIKQEKIDSINLSSGQHIMICTITELIANIENESIILFDEPEIHLHPNAIANLMRMFTLLLERFNSYAIFSTHSPLIIQEVPSKYINVLNRTDDILTVRRPDVECFGNNITDIIFDAFDVSNEESNYKTILCKLSKTMSYDEVIKLFDDDLSVNALLYLKNCYCVEESK